MKKIILVFLAQACVFTFFLSCGNKTTAPEPQATFTVTPQVTSTITPSRTLTGTIAATGTETPAITATVTMTVTRVCGYYAGYNANDDTDSWTIGTIFATKFTASANTTIYTIYAKFNSGTGIAGMGIYSDNSDEPGTLLAQTTAKNAVTGWNSADLNTPLYITAGTTYWLAAAGDLDGLRTNTNITADTVKYYTFTYINTLPANPAGWTSRIYDVKIYAVGCSY